MNAPHKDRAPVLVPGVNGFCPSSVVLSDESVLNVIELHNNSEEINDIE